MFRSNLRRIENLNAQKSSATFAVNKFGDLTAQEFKALYTMKTSVVRDPSWPVESDFNEDFVEALPTSFDWRNKGAVTGVKDQGQCGSCWAFSAVGNMEGQNFLAGNPLVGLSEQNLVDCDKECMNYQNQQTCDAGCDGGLMPNAFEYVIKNGGIDSEASYPYLGYDNTCAFNKNSIGATIKSWSMVSSNETQMWASLVANGPISIAVDATEWQFYFAGIFDFPFCGTSLDHGVLIVGVDHSDNILFEDTPYWIIKNSWGSDWGHQGYIYLERNEGLCGVNLFPCSSKA